MFERRVKPRGRCLVIAALLAAVNVIAPLVLQANLAAGVYRTDADSIAIGLFQIWALTVAGVAGLMVVGGATHGARWLCARVRSNVLRDVCTVLAGLGYACALLYFTLWALAWCVPNHYSIAACAGGLTLAVAWAAWFDVRSLRHVCTGKPYESVIHTRTSMLG
jgi:hypothetical protein